GGGDWNNTKAFLDAFARSGFDVFAGSETFLLRNMRGGGTGCISATANVNPAAIARLHETWQRGDADAQQARLDEIRGTFAKFPMIPALKAAIAHYGHDAPWATVRPPLVELTSDQAKALVTELTSDVRPGGGPRAPPAALECRSQRAAHDRRHRSWRRAARFRR